MKKKIKTTLFFVLFFVICGCGEADKKENNMNEPTQKQEAQNHSPATKKRQEMLTFWTKRPYLAQKFLKIGMMKSYF